LLDPFEVDANKSIQPLRAISCKNDLSQVQANGLGDEAEMKYMARSAVISTIKTGTQRKERIQKQQFSNTKQLLLSDGT
jgi:hypothetical protein